MARVAVNGTEVEVAPYTTGGSGTQIDPSISASQQNFVKINNVNIVVSGDEISTHRLYGLLGVITDTHSGASIIAAPSSYVTINGIGVCVTGDASSCSGSHTVKNSPYDFVDIGE